MTVDQQATHIKQQQSSVWHRLPSSAIVLSVRHPLQFAGLACGWICLTDGMMTIRLTLQRLRAFWMNSPKFYFRAKQKTYRIFFCCFTWRLQCLCRTIHVQYSIVCRGSKGLCRRLQKLFITCTIVYTDTMTSDCYRLLYGPYLLKECSGSTLVQNGPAPLWSKTVKSCKPYSVM